MAHECRRVDLGRGGLGLAALTGISDDERELRRHSWRSKRFAAELDRIERMKKALSDFGRIRMLTRKFISELIDADAILRAEVTEKAARETLAGI
jgi:hypothetical protein